MVIDFSLIPASTSCVPPSKCLARSWSCPPAGFFSALLGVILVDFQLCVSVIDRGTPVQCFGSQCKDIEFLLWQEWRNSSLPVSDSEPTDRYLIFREVGMESRPQICPLWSLRAAHILDTSHLTVLHSLGCAAVL
ncbi:hypothetical protein Tco_0710953 [Tanacetum coccineum]